MSDYAPVYLPGHVVPFTASSAVVGGQVVILTGAMQVGPATSDSNKVVGVAAHDAAAGTKVGVFLNAPVHETVSTGTIAAGDPLISDAAGAVKTIGAGANKIGLALIAASGGAVVRWIDKK